MLRRQTHGIYLSSRLSSSATKRVAAHCISYSTDCNKQIYAADGAILSICQNTFSACNAWCRQHCVFTAALHQSNHVNMLMPVTQSHSAMAGLVTWGLEARNFIPFFFHLLAFPFSYPTNLTKISQIFPLCSKRKLALCKFFHTQVRLAHCTLALRWGSQPGHNTLCIQVPAWPFPKLLNYRQKTQA